MKPRPRHVEREIARLLSAYYARFGLPEVRRIPVLGRTGPDIEINQLGLVVDVKSRASNPRSHIVPRGQTVRFNAEMFPTSEARENYLGCRLDEIDLMHDLPMCERPPSTVVARWLAHMEEWTQEHAPEGVSALVLHLPGVPYGASTLILYERNRRTIHERCQHNFCDPLTAPGLIHGSGIRQR